MTVRIRRWHPAAAVTLPLHYRYITVTLPKVASGSSRGFCRRLTVPYLAHARAPHAAAAPTTPVSPGTRRRRVRRSASPSRPTRASVPPRLRASVPPRPTSPAAMPSLSLLLGACHPHPPRPAAQPRQHLGTPTAPERGTQPVPECLWNTPPHLPSSPICPPPHLLPTPAPPPSGGG